MSEQPNEGSVLGGGIVQDCPISPLTHYHDPIVCETRPVRLNLGSVERKSIYEGLREGGKGATMVPNQHTSVCPLTVENLESETAVRGLDTTWIVENTSSKTAVVSWVVNGIEYSPYNPDILAIDDPKARVAPGEWLNVPTFDGFIYHAREVDEEGNVGRIVLQHRVGLIPMGNPRGVHCDPTVPDVEPLNPETAERIPEYAGVPVPEVRKCNVVDVSFRNQAGCPLHVYWASGTRKIPETGFLCGEKFRFHLGTKPATQDFMLDWESSTKFEGSFIGHTFIARLASNPNIVVDSHTVETTKIIDCPQGKQQQIVTTAIPETIAEVIIDAEGNTVLPSQQEPNVDGDSSSRFVMGGAGSVA